MKVKEESEKVGLKLNSQKTKIMASGLITSWQIDGETMETERLYFLGLQNSCRWCLQSWYWKMFAPWKKSYDQPRQHIKKQRYYFANKGHLVKAMVFPVVVYGCESWTIKKVKCWRTDAFELWYWSPLDCRETQLVHPKGNQSWVFIGRTNVETETPVFGHLI